MSSVHVEKVGDTVTLSVDGNLFMLLSTRMAIELGLALYKIGTYGADALDEPIPEPPSQP